MPYSRSLESFSLRTTSCSDNCILYLYFGMIVKEDKDTIN